MFTITRYEQVLCDVRSNDYFMFMVIGIIAIIVWPIGLLAAACYLIRVAPHRSSHDPKFLVQTRFLFFRFRPERYYWGVIICFRSFLLAIAVTLMPQFMEFLGDGSYSSSGSVAALQAWCVCVVLMAALLAQVSFWPWKNDALNFLDTSLLTCLLFFGIVMLSLAPRRDTTRYGMIILYIVFRVLL